MKKILFAFLLVIFLLTNPLPGEAARRFIIPTTNLFLIDSPAEWEELIRREFPQCSPKEVLGYAHYRGRENTYSIYICPPCLKSLGIYTWELYEEVLGHEIMHIINYYLKWELFPIK